MNNSAEHCQVVFKFDKLVHYRPLRPRNCEIPLPVKCKMADGAQIRHIQQLRRGLFDFAELNGYGTWAAAVVDC